MVRCPKCGKDKLVSEFGQSASGRSGYCKQCMRERSVQKVEAKCNVCGQQKMFNAGRRTRVCLDCRREREKVPCPACGATKVRKAKNCVDCTDTTGSLNPNWRGGTTRHWKGYVYVRVGQKYRFEHQLVMEDFLRRPLAPDEEVHHLNGVRCDNRLENLELWTRSHPTGTRVVDALRWARELISRYEDLEPDRKRKALGSLVANDRLMSD
jgi:HNH endonuclease